MVEKIVDQYEKLKAILIAFNKSGKAEPEKLVEDIKASVKEFQGVLDTPEETPEVAPETPEVAPTQET